MNDLETHKSKMKKLLIYLNNYELRKYETFFSYKIFIMTFYTYGESRTYTRNKLQEHHQLTRIRRHIITDTYDLGYNFILKH